MASQASNLFFVAEAKAEKNNIATFAALPLDTMDNHNVDARLQKKAELAIIRQFAPCVGISKSGRALKIS